MKHMKYNNLRSFFRHFDRAELVVTIDSVPDLNVNEFILDFDDSREENQLQVE